MCTRLYLYVCVRRPECVFVCEYVHTCVKECVRVFVYASIHVCKCVYELVCTCVWENQSVYLRMCVYGPSLLNSPKVREVSCSVNYLEQRPFFSRTGFPDPRPKKEDSRLSAVIEELEVHVGITQRPEHVLSFHPKPRSTVSPRSLVLTYRFSLCFFPFSGKYTS